MTQTLTVDRIPVALARKGSVELSISVQTDELDLATEGNALFEEVKLSGRVYLVDKDIIADVDVAGERQSTCSRCLEQFTEDFKKKCLFVTAIIVGRSLRKAVLGLPRHLRPENDYLGKRAVPDQSKSRYPVSFGTHDQAQPAGRRS